MEPRELGPRLRRGAERRGSRAARRRGTLLARGRSRGLTRRAGAGRRRAAPASVEHRAEPERPATSLTRCVDVVWVVFRTSARTPCSRAPSCADRARSSGRPSRCRAPAAAGGDVALADVMRRPSASRAPRSSAARSTCRSRRANEHEELAVGDLQGSRARRRSRWYYLSTCESYACMRWMRCCASASASC